MELFMGTEIRVTSENIIHHDTEWEQDDNKYDIYKNVSIFTDDCEAYYTITPDWQYHWYYGLTSYYASKTSDGIYDESHDASNCLTVSLDEISIKPPAMLNNILHEVWDEYDDMLILNITYIV